LREIADEDVKKTGLKKRGKTLSSFIEFDDFVLVAKSEVQFQPVKEADWKVGGGGEGYF
jgi:hypothetical protein